MAVTKDFADFETFFVNFESHIADFESPIADFESQKLSAEALLSARISADKSISGTNLPW